MKALTHSTRSTYWLAVCASVVAAGMALASPAHAADVFWTVGIQQPGVNVTVGNAPPVPVVVSQPAVIVQQPPVVVAQAPVIMQPAPVVVRPAPVVVAQPQVVYPAQQVVYVPERHHLDGHPWGHGYWREHERRDYAYGYGRGHDHDRH